MQSKTSDGDYEKKTDAWLEFWDGGKILRYPQPAQMVNSALEEILLLIGTCSIQGCVYITSMLMKQWHSSHVIVMS